MGNLESAISLTPDAFGGGRWKEAGVPGGKPCEHEENVQTPHRKSQWPHSALTVTY